MLLASIKQETECEEVIWKFEGLTNENELVTTSALGSI